ncbi:MAG: DUF1028 domain-containing protein [Chloroflexi bacterium]|nr:DUF1028 domain-containing protein [Chloroflexota bacterium]
MIYLSTHSVIGHDPKTDEFGIAVASAIVSVGWLSRYAAPGAGVIAIQAWSNPYVGLDGLKLLKQGHTAQDVLDATLKGDAEEDRRKRQCSIIDARGGMAVYTGPDCQDWKGHVVGKHSIAAGNLLVDNGEAVVRAMVDEFEATPENEPLAEKLLRGLQAGQDAGGDRRGRISSSLFVVREHEYPWVDIRVDSHIEPIVEMRRIYEAFKKFHHTRPQLFNLPRIRHILDA